MSQPRLAHEFDWTGRSEDPNDVQFGDVVEWCGPGDLDAYDVVLVGEPYDGGVIGRPGAAEGPMAIRDALAGRKTHHIDVGPVAADGNDTGQVAVEGADPGLRVGDLGDVALGGDVRDAQDDARAVAARIHPADALPVFLGGDNSLTCANVAPLLPEVAVLNFDAHLDVREVRDGPTSGTPYRQLWEAGLADYACLGARHFETSTAYHEYVAERDGTVVTAETVGDDPGGVVERALANLDASSVYVSVDVDVLDATAAPGVSAPTPGGLTTRELFRALRVAADDDRVAGFEVVECAPPLDRDGRTADAAAGAVAQFLAGVSDRG